MFLSAVTAVAGRETAGRKTAGRETAGLETAGCETTGHEITGRETAGRETAGRESRDVSGTKEEWMDVVGWWWGVVVPCPMALPTAGQNCT